MDIDDIKQFIPEDGEKIILMENGKPIVVLMSFNTYKKEFKSVKQDRMHNNEEVNQESAKRTAFSSLPSPRKRDSVKNELTIEDLPF